MTDAGLTRRELDPMKCGTPGCQCAGPLVLTSQCHPRAPVMIEYDWTTGALTAFCYQCQAVVCVIAVAP